MARRQIRLDQISEHMEGEVLKLVRATTLEWEGRVKAATPEDTGRLKNDWESKVERFVGEINNRMDYAVPVCYGTNLPASWGGQYRTRKIPPTVPGFPDIIGKELESWAQWQYRKIVRES